MQTPYQIAKAKKEAAIAREYHQLMALPDARASVVESRLMKKHGIHSDNTIRNIVRRVAARQPA